MQAKPDRSPFFSCQCATKLQEVPQKQTGRRIAASNHKKKGPLVRLSMGGMISQKNSSNQNYKQYLYVLSIKSFRHGEEN